MRTLAVVALALMPALTHAQAGGDAGTNNNSYPADMGQNGSQFLRYADPGLSGSAGANPLTDVNRVLSQNPYMNDNGTGGYDGGLHSSNGTGTHTSRRVHKSIETRNPVSASNTASPAVVETAVTHGNGGMANRTMPSTSQSWFPILFGGLLLGGAGLALERWRASGKRTHILTRSRGGAET